MEVQEVVEEREERERQRERERLYFAPLRKTPTYFAASSERAARRGGKCAAREE